jgi:hypothetical protein
MAKKDIAYWKALLITVTVAVGGWAVFSLAKYGVEVTLAKWGVESIALQYVIIIVGAVVIVTAVSVYIKSTANTAANAIKTTVDSNT